MESSWVSYPRKKRGVRTENVCRTKLTTRCVTEHVCEAFENIPVKEIASATGSSYGAAENWKQGLNAMSLAHFLNACREIPELKHLAMQLMGETPSFDPDEERALAILMNKYARRAAE